MVKLNGVAVLPVADPALDPDGRWPIGGGTIDAVYKATIGASLFGYGGAEHTTLVPALLMSRVWSRRYSCLVPATSVMLTLGGEGV